ncbi:MAG TPA: hypothetical protein PLP19_11675 [bacterium]|nr:hypothetical protein [bacterium]HPN44140.1 hypothetical protein [bacterium]
MNIFKAISNGITLVITNYKMALIVYLVNILLAILIAIPVYSTLKDNLSDRGVRDVMEQNFDYEWWSSFNFKAEGLEKTIRPALSSGFALLFDNFELFLTGKFTGFGTVIFFWGLAMVFISAFFNGGVIGLYADEKRTFSVSRFFSLSGFYFHHFFALALTMLLVVFVFYKTLHPLILNLADQSAGGTAGNAWPVYILAYLLLIFIIFFIKIVFDYAKIILVLENKNSSWLCIWLAVKFVVRHLFKTFGLYLLLSVIGLCLVLCFGFLLDVVNASSLFILLTVILLQQLFIFIKIGLRFSFYASQLELYRQRSVEVVTGKIRRKVK